MSEVRGVVAERVLRGENHFLAHMALRRPEVVRQAGGENHHAVRYFDNMVADLGSPRPAGIAAIENARTQPANQQVSDGMARALEQYQNGAVQISSVIVPDARQSESGKGVV